MFLKKDLYIIQYLLFTDINVGIYCFEAYKTRYIIGDYRPSVLSIFQFIPYKIGAQTQIFRISRLTDDIIDFRNYYISGDTLYHESRNTGCKKEIKGKEDIDYIDEFFPPKLSYWYLKIFIPII